MIKINKELFGTLAICAIRYCQGRMTYMPDWVRGIVRPHLRELTDKDLAVLINDCEDQRRHGSYGDEKIDKPGWIKWEQELKSERSRRIRAEAEEDRFAAAGIGQAFNSDERGDDNG